MKGVVKWYKDKTGIGFVTATVDGESTSNILIHYTQLVEVKTLNEGDNIEFNLHNDKKGMSAKNIRLIHSSICTK